MRNDNSDDHKMLTTRIKCNTGPEKLRELNLPRRRTAREDLELSETQETGQKCCQKFRDSPTCLAVAQMRDSANIKGANPARRHSPAGKARPPGQSRRTSSWGKKHHPNESSKRTELILPRRRSEKREITRARQREESEPLAQPARPT